jgi:hypothetical protein
MKIPGISITPSTGRGRSGCCVPRYVCVPDHTFLEYLSHCVSPPLPARRLRCVDRWMAPCCRSRGRIGVSPGSCSPAMIGIHEAITMGTACPHTETSNSSDSATGNSGFPCNAPPRLHRPDPQGQPPVTVVVSAVVAGVCLLSVVKIRQRRGRFAQR